MSSEPSLPTTADVVIVGGGSAGCVLAARLAADPARRVVLIEAGSARRPMESKIPAAFPKLFRTPADWAYETEPQAGLDGRRLFWPRGRMLGGSGAMNAQMWIQPDPADLAAWRAAAPRTWSPERVAVARAALHAHMAPEGLRDPSELSSAFVSSASTLGLRATADVNDDLGGDRVGPTPVSQRRGVRHSPRDAYLAHRPANLTVVADALVARVVVQDGRATGVEYVVGGHRRVVHAGTGVILAAGAIGSPQLLQLSGIGAADHLRRLGLAVAADLPAVGRHLRDHLMSIVVATTDGRVRTLLDAERPSQLLSFLLRRRGMLTSNVAEATAFLRSTPTEPAVDLQWIWAPVMFLDHGATAPTGHGVSIGTVLLQPHSEGEVAIRTTRPGDAPRIDPRYLSDPDGRDLATLVTGVERALDVMRSRPLAGHVTGAHEPVARTRAELQRFVRARAETVYHPVGTCRLGTDPADAVVDPDFRVHGIDGLWVADASVLPTIPRANTAAATMLVAELAAATIAAAGAPTARLAGVAR